MTTSLNEDRRGVMGMEIRGASHRKIPEGRWVI